MIETVRKSGLRYASLGIILITGILEYSSPAGVYLSWGYMVGMLLSLVSGKWLDVVLSTMLSLIFVISSFFRIEDRTDIEIILLARTYAVLGFVFVSFFLVRYLRRERRAAAEKSLMAGIFSHGTQGIFVTEMN